MSQKQTLSSWQLWMQQIKLWPRRFMAILVLILIMLPVSLCVLVLLPYIIQSINSTPGFLYWEKFVGHQMAVWIAPFVEHTMFQDGISLDFQQSWFALILIGLAAIYGFLNYYSDYLLRDLGELLAQKMRNNIANKYLALTHSAATTLDAGLLSAMVGEDMREAQQTFTRLVSSFLKDGLSSLIFIFWLVFLDYKLFILFVTILVPAALVLRITSKVLKRLSRQGLQFESDLLSGLLERMRGWQTIQVYKSIPFEILNFNKINDKIYHIWRRATRARTLGTPLVEWLGIIAGALILIVALRRISAHELDNTILTNFVVTVALLSDKINRMSSQLNTTRKGTDALHRVYQFLNTPFETRTATQLKDTPQLNLNSLSLAAVSIGNTASEVLKKDINLTLKLGDLLVVAGPSGSGKSTFIRTLLGVQPTLTGTILMNNENANEQLFQQLSHSIGFIPQEPFLFTGSIFENVVYPKRIEHPSPADFENAKRALHLVNLSKNLEDGVMGLSGGEKQRLMFARIFFHKPSLIIIDEGTSALDLANELAVLKCLKEFGKQAIICAVSHRLAIREYGTHFLDFSQSK